MHEDDDTESIGNDLRVYNAALNRELLIFPFLLCCGNALLLLMMLHCRVWLEENRQGTVRALDRFSHSAIQGPTPTPSQDPGQTCERPPLALQNKHVLRLALDTYGCI